MPLAPEKEQALHACSEQHAALLACFKTCTFVSSFTGCCTEEHRVFWECYTGRRGTNKTRISSWFDNFFSRPDPQQQPQQPQQQQTQEPRQ